MPDEDEEAVQYKEHPSRTGLMRDGDLVPHPEAEHADCTVWCFIDSAQLWEGLLARRLGAAHARICAVPIFAYDLNFGDEVEFVESAEGAPVIVGRRVDAGNLGYRIWLPETPTLDWEQCCRSLGALGCLFDVFSPRLIGVSVPPTTASVVADWLHQREQFGELQYETTRGVERS